MEITVAGARAPYKLEQLNAASAANNYPDILFFAGGEVFQSGVKAKFRITAKWEGGSVIHKWTPTVEYLAIDTQNYGHMSDGVLVKSDDIPNKGIEITLEVNTGSGYEMLGPVAAEGIAPANVQVGLPGVYGLYFQAVNAAASAGCVIGLMLIGSPSR